MGCLAIYTPLFGQCFNSRVRNCIVFDLQLFNGEKTEKPTGKRLNQAKRRGQFAKSRELNSVFILFFGFFVLHLLGRFIFETITDFMIFIYSNFPANITVEFLMSLFMQISIVLLKTVFPLMAAILLVAIIINIYQVGLNFNTQPFGFKLSKFNPLSGLKRMVNLQALVELVKAVLKIIIVGYFIWDFLKDEVKFLPQLIYADLWIVLSLVGNMIFDLICQIGLVLFVLAIFDYMYQKWQYIKNLKMSKQEVKDEYKQSEGDPKIKSKIRSKQRQIAMQRMMQEVPKADVIITNPTHFAVALKYEQGMVAPIVVAKGQDLVARRIKEIAHEARIVIVENKPLARALYKSTEIGDMIPQELYKSVAEVLAYVYRLKKKLS